MPLETDIFDIETHKVADDKYLHFINIKDISEELKSHIDSHIVSICDSELDTPIETVKQELCDFFESKDKKTKMGAVAEFIVHLYLKQIGFKQECLFLNLEEGSIKKGFDGYYSFASEEWIMESKSGCVTTAQISHKKKLKEAFDDLKSKIGGNASNNPWKNAFNHAKVVGSEKSIIQNIKQLSNMYISKTYPDIEELNIIPTSTIFHNDTWEDEKIQHNKEEVERAVESMDFKAIQTICVNKKSIDNLLEYITN